MTQVLATAREASDVAERDRVAWNLPPSPAGASAPSQATLDWYGFLARYFPGQRRHNLEALTAYHAYRSSGVTPSSEAAAPDDAEQRESPAVTPQDAWEDDGGATLAESHPPPRGRRGLPPVTS